MTALAPTLQAFFTDRLARHRQASPHTIAAYRDALKLLLVFAARRTDTQPSDLEIADLDAPLIGALGNLVCAGYVLYRLLPWPLHWQLIMYGGVLLAAYNRTFSVSALCASIMISELR